MRSRIGGVSVRADIVAAAEWGIRNAAQIHYTEGAERSGWLRAKPYALPLSTDCSGFATLCYRMAGLPDPNGLGYKELGYTPVIKAKKVVDGKTVYVLEVQRKFKNQTLLIDAAIARDRGAVG